jgi:hypothetical protein
MSHPSPLPPPTHLPMTWTHSSRPVMRFARLLHPTLLSLQVLRSLSPRHAWPRRPISSHTRPRRPHPRHARPRRRSLRHARPRRPSPRHVRPRPRHARPRRHHPPPPPRAASTSRFTEPPPLVYQQRNPTPDGALSCWVVSLPPCRRGS